MKKVVVLAVVLCSGTLAMAQTKRIAHRSHSGTGTFVITDSKDNFGEYKPAMPVAPLPKTDSNAIVKNKAVVQSKAKKVMKSSKRKNRVVHKAAPAQV